MHARKWCCTHAHNAKRVQCTYIRTARTRREINTYMRTVFCLAKCDRGWCFGRFPSTAQWQRAKARDWPCSCPTCKQPTPPSAGCAPLASHGLVPPSRGGFGSPPRRPKSPPPWEGGCPPRRRQGNCRGGRSSNRPRTRAVLAPASGEGSKNRRGGSGLLDFFHFRPQIGQLLLDTAVLPLKAVVFRMKIKWVHGFGVEQGRYFESK